jgi:single-strand selective monofunctional uracil DNA glycosylase
MPASVADDLVHAAEILRDSVDALRFAAPVAHVYNPLRYAMGPYREYVYRFASATRPVLLLGMNPGPFGMMQTGIPFGEVASVRDWMGLRASIDRPALQHPRRPIQGWETTRSEVSGRRLWGWAASRYGRAEQFFARHCVLNYCPLVFLEASGRNRTPDQLRRDERSELDRHCMRHLETAIRILQAKVLIGVGGFAADRLRSAVERLGHTDSAPRVIRVLHPSPASPAANRGWEEAVDATLQAEAVLTLPWGAPGQGSG